VRPARSATGPLLWPLRGRAPFLVSMWLRGPDITCRQARATLGKDLLAG